MKTLKAKLFFSMGAVLLLVGALNIILAEVWIKRGLARTGSAITEHVKKIEDRIEKFSSFLLTLRMVEQAAELEGAVYRASSFKQGGGRSLLEKGVDILLYDPQTAFISMQKGLEEGISIVPQDAPLHAFSFARDEEGVLWVKIEGREDVFIAMPSGEDGKENYLLFTEESIRKAVLQNKVSFNLKRLEQKVPVVFQKVELQNTSYGLQDSVSELFTALLSTENEWLYKMDLLQAIIAWTQEGERTPEGAVKIAGQNGGALLADQIFSKANFVKELPGDSVKEGLFLLVREGKSGKDVDVVREFVLGNDIKVSLGFSVYSVLKEISLLSNKIILINGEGVDLGINSDGVLFDAKEITSSNKKYVPFTMDFSLFSVSILTPEEDALSINKFLLQMGQEMTANVVLSLIGAAGISFIIALIFLRNVAKKITDPIAILSKAAELLGDGHYEKIVLPKISHRQDEVAKLSRSFSGMITALQDRDKIRGVLNKVVSKEISEEILRGNLDFTGEERVLTLLFSDIRSFTKMSEGLSPKILIPMLNLYMTRMCRIIDETHGVVDKFVGDEIMTLYGAPMQLEFHAILAIEAALRMMQDLDEWNKERKEKNEITFEIGIGIHTGLVYTGNMGAENRLNYTAIGANVNLASRICSVAKPMQILITEETLASPGVKNKFRINPLEPVSLKGVELKVQVYEVIGLL